MRKILTLRVNLRAVLLLSLLLTLVSISISEAYARAGRGRSFGARRSQRGYGPSNPYRPYRTQQNNNDQRNYSSGQNQGGFQTNQQSGRSSMFKNIAGGMAAGLAGGFIGNMLFRSVAGHAGTPANGILGGNQMGGNGGIGMLEILIFAGIGFLLYKFFKSRKEMAAISSASANTNPTSTHSYRDRDDEPTYNHSENRSTSFHQNLSWRDNEIQHKEKWQDMFFNIQTAWSSGDLTAASHLLTPETARYFQDEMNQLKSQNLRNTVDRIAIRETEVIEEWAENGREFVAVKLNANVIDYTQDINSGNIIEGSKTQQVRFEECWTFCRDGYQDWKLAGIEQENSFS